MENGKSVIVPEVVETTNQATPDTLFDIAVKGGATLDQLEKYLALKEKWDDQQAKKAYYVAISSFKSSPPEIEKDKKVSYKTGSGTTVYSHASLGNVTEQINSSLSKHGLSAGWITKQDGSNVTVTCRITHVMGHSEETSLTAELDTSGGKNTIQALGSTISYLERYTILALTGLATQDQDDDGKSTEEIKYISDKELSTITDMVNAKEVNLPKFLEYLKVESLEKILASDFTKAMAALRAKKTKEDKK